MIVTFFGVILLAAVASFMLGWLWYSNALFGKIWAKEMGVTKDHLSKEQMKKMMTKIIVAGIIVDFVRAFCLMFLSITFSANQFFIGFFIWLGFLVPVLLNSIMYERRSGKLFMINAGYQLASILLMGLVFYFV